MDLNYLKEIAFESCYRPTKFEEANQLAASEYSRKLCSKGPLFPDQVVFLGPKIYSVNNKKEFKSVLEEFKLKDKLPIIIVKKAGVLVPYDISHESEELLLALSIIISKIPDGKKLNYLNKSQVDELTKSDAEKYRLKLNT